MALSGFDDHVTATSDDAFHYYTAILAGIFLFCQPPPHPSCHGSLLHFASAIQLVLFEVFCSGFFFPRLLRAPFLPFTENDFVGCGCG
jgi:hypothetical protein